MNEPALLAGLLLALNAGLLRADSTTATNQFKFRFPRPAAYRFESLENNRWLMARPEDGTTNFIAFGNRIVVQLKSPADLPRLIAGRGLKISRSAAPDVFILQAPDAVTAAREAQRLATLPGVLASYPVLRRQISLHGPYAPQPSEARQDPGFTLEWPLENRNADGSRHGVDLNVRAAWPYTLGRGVTIAVADTGIEMAHEELSNNLVGAPHYNFVLQNTSAGPIGASAAAAHATEVAGLAAADINHARLVGVAPGAKLASWVILDTNFMLASDEQLMDMYQYQSNTVAVQNHSWGDNGVTQEGPTLLEQIGISNAVTFGRNGRGVVMVRSCGNDRQSQANADDDGYPDDPRVIAVAAVFGDGHTVNYSEPGACVLVAAPSGENGTNLFTTDLLGTAGADPFNYYPPNQDLSDYAFNSFGFAGTSASAPQIAGVAALMLSVNSNLTYRDAQQILILSALQWDAADPDLVTNGAGFVVSHNDGFGVPDAGVAVRLARHWKSRPTATNLTLTSTNVEAIPDDGLRVRVSGEGVPANLTSIHCLPGTGPHADTPTASLPLEDFGLGTNAAGYDLTNAAALIERGTNTFADKIANAARAGAAFAVIYNYPTNVDTVNGGDRLTGMAATDFTPIPAVFIGNSDGEALKALFATNRAALAQIHLTSTSYAFTVTNTLLCEHVGLRVTTDHPARGDLRITLVSPMGTRSVLQALNNDTNAGPADWTYYSTHDFFESSAGNWTACFSDERSGNTGSVQQVSLMIQGVPITDTDHDGLDDNWELAHFGNLNQGPRDDPNRDGYSNMREQLMGADPNAPAAPFPLNLSPWNTNLARLSWPASPDYHYEIWGGTNADTLDLVTNIPGGFPETEWFTPYIRLPREFFQARAVANP
ncbi:MAG: S8 family serine peptidase [Verrucomicrobiota bacterium]|nr:S8 family serine peptidase [Verrucomicrobiota bacterium]